MASLDPRKAESITNQANYLMTVITLAMGGVIAGIIEEPEKIPILFMLLGVWTVAFLARTLKTYIEQVVASKKKDVELAELQMEFNYKLQCRELDLKACIEFDDASGG